MKELDEHVPVLTFDPAVSPRTQAKDTQELVATLNSFVKDKNPKLCKLEKLVKSFRYDMSQRAVIKKHNDANAIRTYDKVNLDLKEANKSTLRVLPLDNRHYK